MCNSVAVSTFTVTCDDDLCPVPRHFHHPIRKPWAVKQSLNIPSSPTLATTSLLPVSMDLLILNISNKQNHTMWPTQWVCSSCSLRSWFASLWSLFPCVDWPLAYSLDTCLFRSFAHDFTGLFLLLSCTCPFYILDTRPISDMHSKLFPSLCGLSFHFLQGFLLIKSNLLLFLWLLVLQMS